MREIYADKSGLCDICREWKTTVVFEDEERGYGGWNVCFEICLDCFEKKLEETENNLIGKDL